MDFKTTVILVASIILIIMLIIIGIALYQVQKNLKFPPVISKCPDYWVMKDKVCNNPKHLGTCGDTKDFNTNFYKGHNSNCLKSKWAERCELTWQGLTNNAKICDSSSISSS